MPRRPYIWKKNGLLLHQTYDLVTLYYSVLSKMAASYTYRKLSVWNIRKMVIGSVFYLHCFLNCHCVIKDDFFLFMEFFGAWGRGVSSSL
jgi:hypothetical protein